jgi:DNA-binding NtrC family response regulator
MTKRILVVDDDAASCELLREIFAGEGWEAESAQTPEAALDLASRERFDLVVSDINLESAQNGLDILREMRDACPVILVTGFGTLDAAVESAREGAWDFVSKPFKVEEVVATARRALDRSRDGGGDAAEAEKLSSSYEQTLLESELFGYVRGAFTGAASDRKGLWEEAEGGTLFLDEAGETSPAMQVKLLRALQEGEIRRVGSTKPVNVDARVVAATNRDLEKEVRAGRFREDLFYRLSVVNLHVPPLRERRGDVPLLAERFLRAASENAGRALLRLSEEALARLVSYNWPGNVRELESAVEYAALHARGSEVAAEDLPPKLQTLEVRQAASRSPLAALYEDLPSLDELERRYLLHVLEATGGNRTRTAEVLRIDRRTLYRMAERFRIKLDEE